MNQTQMLMVRRRVVATWRGCVGEERGDMKTWKRVRKRHVGINSVTRDRLTHRKGQVKWMLGLRRLQGMDSALIKRSCTHFPSEAICTHTHTHRHTSMYCMSQQYIPSLHLSSPVSLLTMSFFTVCGSTFWLLLAGETFWCIVMPFCVLLLPVDL